MNKPTHIKSLANVILSAVADLIINNSESIEVNGKTVEYIKTDYLRELFNKVKDFVLKLEDIENE